MFVGGKSASVDRPHYFKPLEEVRVTRNRLPHWEQDDATYFLTFRAVDSLPQRMIKEWKEERSLWLAQHPEPWCEEEACEYDRRFSRTRERWLDEGHGNCPFRDPLLRDEVLRAFFRLPGSPLLWSLVAMPNHLHALVSLDDGRDGAIGRFVRHWKGASARRVNLARKKSGPVWSKDYFDRLIRDEAHFGNCARYIRNNPRKAKLRAGEFLLQESAFVRERLDGGVA